VFEGGRGAGDDQSHRSEQTSISSGEPVAKDGRSPRSGRAFPGLPLLVSGQGKTTSRVVAASAVAANENANSTLTMASGSSGSQVRASGCLFIFPSHEAGKRHRTNASQLARRARRVSRLPTRTHSGCIRPAFVTGTGCGHGLW
jgi:hypothetical protein